MLWKAGVIFPEGDKRPYANDDKYPARFEAHLNIDQIAPTLMAGAWATYAPTVDVLYELMECAYIAPGITPHFKSSAKPFPVSSTFQSIFSKLASCGFVIQEGDLYRYTDKVGKAFKQGNVWSHDTYAEELASEIQYEKERDQEHKLMYETMPEDWKKVFFEHPEVGGGLSMLLAERWDWHKKKWLQQEEWYRPAVWYLSSAKHFLETYGPIYRAAHTR